MRKFDVEMGLASEDERPQDIHLKVCGVEAPDYEEARVLAGYYVKRTVEHDEFVSFHVEETTEAK